MGGWGGVRRASARQSRQQLKFCAALCAHTPRSRRCDYRPPAALSEADRDMPGRRCAYCRHQAAEHPHGDYLQGEACHAMPCHATSCHVTDTSAPTVTIFKNTNNILVTAGDWYFFSRHVSWGVVGTLGLMVRVCTMHGQPMMQIPSAVRGRASRSRRRVALSGTKCALGMTKLAATPPLPLSRVIRS